MTATNPVARLRSLETRELDPGAVAAIRAILVDAFGTGDEAFAEEDWTHALGGRHFVLDVGGRIVTHAAVVERVLRIGGRSVRTGYVEAVATAPGDQGRGYGTITMTSVTAYVRESFDLGALGTGRHAFYERLGWATWRGPAFVRTAAGVIRTREDEGFILVLRTPTSFAFDGDEPINCDERIGDAW